jgi:hypothetical protein
MAHDIVDLLFPPPAYRRSSLGLLRWWEARRLHYNVTVGSAGLVTLALVWLFGALPPAASNQVIPLRVVVAYAILANVCYTFGWLTELGVERMWGNRAPLMGPALFRQGLSFSVGLTLLPVVLAGLYWLIRLAGVLGL